MSTSLNPDVAPTDAGELVAWTADTLGTDAEVESLLRASGRVHAARRPPGGTHPQCIARERMPAGGRRQPFSGLGGPHVQVLFYATPDQPSLGDWHRAAQSRAYELLTGQMPVLTSSRVVQPLRRVRRPGPPRYDDEIELSFTMSTYHASLAPKA